MQADLFTPPAPRKEPRYYQTDCVHAVEKSVWQEGSEAALVVMATGLGKTFVASLLTSRRKGRVLFIAHRDELLQQSQKDLESYLEEPVGLEQGPFREYGERVVVASINTLYQDRRLERFDPSEFDYAIVDEAHHSLGDMYQKVIDHFRGKAKIVGLTATPNRGDKKALGRIYDDVAFIYDIADGIKDGWLVPVRVDVHSLDEVNLKRVKVSAGDFQIKALDEEIQKGVEAAVHLVYDKYDHVTPIWFLPGLDSAEYTYNKLNLAESDSAVFIHGGQSSGPERIIRRHQVEGFRKGRYRHLVNVGVATEGFDAPSANCVSLLRPTKSTALLTQMVGRGTRPEPGVVDAFPGRDQAEQRKAAIAASKKPFLTVLEFTGSIRPGSLARPADVLGGSYDDDVVAKAKEASEERPGEDILDLLDEMKARQDELKRRLAEEAKRTQVEKVKITVRQVDPFSVAGVSEKELEKMAQMDRQYGRKPPTQKQAELLKKLGVDDWDKMSKHQASKVLDGLLSRRKKGLGTLKQIKQIRRFVAVPDDLSAHTADRAMAYIAKTVYKREGAFNVSTLRKLVGLEEREPGDDDI